MRIAIIQFPGSNCERETMLAVKRAGMEPVEFLWNAPRETLPHFDGFIIVGGFSYEDRSRAGVIAALDPLLSSLKEQSEWGKPILGICNGAQILVESGLVPGIEKNKLALSLTDNKRIQQGRVLGTGYYNAWVNMRLSDHYQRNAFTRHLTPKNILRLPVAHGEGRFVIGAGLLAEMQHHGLSLFQYCDEKGNVIDEFPINPNGSICNLAAISNKTGNVMAMMPHPERTTTCDPIFTSMREYIQEGNYQKAMPLNYSPRSLEIKKFSPAGKSLVVDLIIADNQALSVENALYHANIPVQIKRFTHWEVECSSSDIFEKVKQSGVLFNDRKEKCVMPETRKHRMFLVRAKEDMLGQQKLQLLRNYFGVDGVHAIRHGTVWEVNGTDASINDVLHSHILFNPYAHDCYDY